MVSEPTSVSTPVSPSSINIDTLIKSYTKDFNCKQSNSELSSENINLFICGENNTLNIIFTIPSSPSPPSSSRIAVAQILSDNYQWQYDSSDKIDGGIDFGKIWKSEMNGKRTQFLLEKSRYLISVGTASEEGKSDYNEGLAINRSKEITKHTRAQVPKAASPSLEFYHLVLGRYKGENTSCKSPFGISTKYQRPIILLHILDDGKSYALSNINKEVEAKLQDLPSYLKPSCYEKFDLTL